uniref:Uncharacterized protein n=1 Tax=Physcomitrium patens TaxID=3218 RepID=A0A2K1IF66_PHYPA|nr:hypothetical protein PHYPA_028512 [Physcomitrium patens]
MTSAKTYNKPKMPLIHHLHQQRNIQHQQINMTKYKKYTNTNAHIIRSSKKEYTKLTIIKEAIARRPASTAARITRTPQISIQPESTTK